MQGTVLCGINNFFTVLSDGIRYECRLKGKILTMEEQEYNPLAAGDEVEFQIISQQPPKGLICARLPRHNAFVRFNKKLAKPQTLAANFDILAAVTSVDEPPFRPRFLDRVFVSAPENCESWIIVNKTDLELTQETKRRLKGFEEIGVRLFWISVKEKRGLEELTMALEDKRTLFVGQSGVGKSSLLNALRPDASQRVAAISEKYKRGCHTTNFSLLFPQQNSLPELIDSPGIREIEVYGVELGDLHFHFPEFSRFECGLSGCRHLTEPRCGVLKALEDGNLDEDRYFSYVNIYEQLEQRGRIYR